MTLQQLQHRLELYLNAEQKLLEGNQEWEIDGERFRRVDLESVQAEIRRLRNEIATVERVEAGGGLLHTTQAVFGGRR